MRETTDIIVYWVPGCGSCTRLKGYLDDRNVPFRAVNVLAEPDALAEMEASGIASVPWARKGDRWVSGNDLDQVAALVGLADDSSSLLPIETLVSRVQRFLRQSALLVAQLPASHYDDPTPTVERFKQAYHFYADGTPRIGHASSKLLVHHILGHGEKFKRFALVSGGAYELGFDPSSLTGEYGAFGEPDTATPMWRVVDQLMLTASDLGAWLLTTYRTGDLDHTFVTYWGSRSAHQILQTMTCSVAQHTRQLSNVILKLNLGPVEEIRQEDAEGLVLPTTIWG